MSVKWYDSAMPGAPALNTASAGSLLAIFDACLVNGFGAKAITSFVVSNGVATATVPGGHTFSADMVCRVAGATALNGEHRVVSTTTAAVSFATALPDQTISGGSPVIDVPPAGWEKMNGAGQAAYRSTDPASSRYWLHVDDAVGSFTVASVIGCEELTDINTRVNPFPAARQYFAKYVNSGQQATAWSLYADERFMIWMPAFSGGYRMSHAFGDLLPANAVDQHATVLVAPTSAPADFGTVDAPGNIAHTTTVSQNGVLARAYTGFPGPAAMRAVSATFLGSGHTGVSSGAGGAGITGYPNLSDSGLILAPIAAMEVAGGASTMRGTIPGALFVAQYLAGAIADGAILDGTGLLAGRKLRASQVGSQSNNQRGALLVDITGPWR